MVFWGEMSFITLLNLLLSSKWVEKPSSNINNKIKKSTFWISKDSNWFFLISLLFVCLFVFVYKTQSQPWRGWLRKYTFFFDVGTLWLSLTHRDITCFPLSASPGSEEDYCPHSACPSLSLLCIFSIEALFSGTWAFR